MERAQIYILADELKVEFLALLGRESSLVQAFCESRVCFDFIPIHNSKICDSSFSSLKVQVTPYSV